MISCYKPLIKKLSTTEYLDDCIGKLVDLLDFDIAKLIEFNNKKNYALVTKKISERNVNYSRNFSNYINLKATPNSIINLLIKEKEIVVFSKNNLTIDSYVPLINNIESEIYIPLFSDTNESKTVIACIYLGSFNENKTFNFHNYYNDEVVNMITRINNLYETEYLKLNKSAILSSLINVMSEVTNEKEPFMVNHPYRVAANFIYINIINVTIIKYLSI